VFSGIVLSLELHSAATAESSARNRLLPIIPVSIVEELKSFILRVNNLNQNQMTGPAALIFWSSFSFVSLFSNYYQE
jgi:hypothetical protein